MAGNPLQSFAEHLETALENTTFAKLSLGAYRGSTAGLRGIVAREVEIRGERRLNFTWRFADHETSRHYSLADGIGHVRELLGTEFASGHLFTTERDWHLEIDSAQRARISSGRPSVAVRPSTSHDRSKPRPTDRRSAWLHALGVTNERGEVREKMGDKWRQINRFTENIAALFDASELAGRSTLSIVDMGCGKGYLTFAAYDYFANVRGLEVAVLGVEARPNLAAFCNDVARECGFSGLRFQAGLIGDLDLPAVDILIALHACDTATDEAIYKGITAGASLIICAPCCHKELRPQMHAPDVLRPLLRHGIMMDREAEMVTDGLRALLLERSGYSARVFEFIATEHTPKNNMVVGIRHHRPVDVAAAERQIASMKQFFGIEHQRLEEMLRKT
ncbi:MAG TPA: SAM-dependent methyltransferase [Candidatus Kapabacteria bacterium]|nr:SAM-dependent methyltransferase [Candidatus Kapabacteria bacterium]